MKNPGDHCYYLTHNGGGGRQDRSSKNNLLFTTDVVKGDDQLSLSAGLTRLADRARIRVWRLIIHTGPLKPSW